MAIKTKQGYRGVWIATKDDKVIARNNSLLLLEQELKAQGFTEHRVKCIRGIETVYKL